MFELPDRATLMVIATEVSGKRPAGVAVEVIALWLGHAKPLTTHSYVEGDLKTNAECLRRLTEPNPPRRLFPESRHAYWRCSKRFDYAEQKPAEAQLIRSSRHYRQLRIKNVTPNWGLRFQRGCCPAASRRVRGARGGASTLSRLSTGQPRRTGKSYRKELQSARLQWNLSRMGL
jgi:hypothetical protein